MWQSYLFCFSGLPRVLAQDQYCPKEITTKQVSENTPPGWTAAQDKTPQILAGITFFDGPPEQEASLVYDTYTKSKAADVAVWHFAPTSHIWISCGYHSTAVKLSKPLPAKTTECRVTYSREVHLDGNGEIKAISCK
jgi:hypothetical protein